MVGLFPRWDCATGSAAFGPGDRLFAFTDGATDFALASKNDAEIHELGEDAFVELLAGIQAALRPKLPWTRFKPSWRDSATGEIWLMTRR